MSKHPSVEVLHGFAEWDPAALGDQALASHIAQCERCTETVRAWRRGAALLAAGADVPDEKWSDVRARRRIEVEYRGLARLATTSEPPPDLWERIAERARSGIRAVLPLPDADSGWGTHREVAARELDQTDRDDTSRDTTGDDTTRDDDMH